MVFRTKSSYKLIFVTVRFLLLLLIIFGCKLSVLSQGSEDITENDSLIFESSSFYTLNNFETNSYYDLNRFHNYRDYSNSANTARMGNIGLGFHYYDSIPIQNNLNRIIGNYQSYLTTIDNLKFYKTNKPFSSLRYINGAEKEQYFSAFHTQNFGNRLNISFQYDKITSEGFFSQQYINHTKFNSNFNYISYKGNYRLVGYYLFNSLESQENGGVLISENENTDENTILLDISLYDAQNRLSSQEIGVMNEYDMFFSSDTFNSKNRITLGHFLTINKADKNYSDDISSTNEFYDYNFLDSTSTNDSTYGESFSNEIYMRAFNSKLRVGYRNTNYKFFQNFLIDEQFQSQYLIASINDSLKKVKYMASIDKGINGFFKEDVEANFELNYCLDSTIKVNFYGQYLVKTIDPLGFKSRLNHHFFNLDLNNQQKLSFNVGAYHENVKIGFSISYTEVKDYYYFEEDKIATNYHLPIKILKLRLDKNFSFLRNFHLNNKMTFQTASVDSIIPVPKLISQNSLYFEKRMFDETLLLQLGVDYFFIDTYRGLNYDPSLGQYYKSPDRITLGVINQLDLFLNLSINKSAKVFFKMENVLLPTYSELSYRVNNYPIPGRVLKFGLFWRMLN